MIGDLFVRLPEGTVPLADREFRNFDNWLLALGGLLAGTVGVVAGVIVAQRTVRPITELTSAERDLQAGGQSRRAVVTGRNEIAQMAQAFNDLVDSSSARTPYGGHSPQTLPTNCAPRWRCAASSRRFRTVSSTPPALVTSLHEETLRLGRLTADLETMTSADSVQFDLHRERVNLADVVAGAVAGLAHRFEERQLQLILRNEPAPVCGDEIRLRQVVTNLLTNTVKFVPAGEAVTVSTRRLDQWIELGVCDSGPGISADDLDHVFERFYRGKQVRTGGSGIGLAVVTALVHAHGGETTVSNDPEGGACFRIRLPLSNCEPIAPEQR